MLVLLLAAQAQAGAIVCGEDSEHFSKVINVTFDYHGSLSGVVQDRATLQGLGKKFGKSVTALTDAQATTKAEFLGHLQGLLQSPGSVMFNYAGHGIVLP